MSQDGKFNESDDPAIVDLMPDCSEYERVGYVNVGVFSVRLHLSADGNLLIEVDPRVNEGTVDLGTLKISKEASVSAGGIDPDE